MPPISSWAAVGWAGIRTLSVTYHRTFSHTLLTAMAPTRGEGLGDQKWVLDPHGVQFATHNPKSPLKVKA